MPDTASPAIALPCFSGHGHTRRLAEAVTEGAGHARLIDVEHLAEADRACLDAAPAIVFGTPTCMGSSATCRWNPA